MVRLETSSTAKQVADNGKLAQRVGHGSRVVLAGGSRCGEITRGQLLLGLGRLLRFGLLLLSGVPLDSMIILNLVLLVVVVLVVHAGHNLCGRL